MLTFWIFRQFSDVVKCIDVQPNKTERKAVQFYIRKPQSKLFFLLVLGYPCVCFVVLCLPLRLLCTHFCRGLGFFFMITFNGWMDSQNTLIFFHKQSNYLSFTHILFSFFPDAFLLNYLASFLLGNKTIYCLCVENTVFCSESPFRIYCCCSFLQLLQSVNFLSMFDIE